MNSSDIVTPQMDELLLVPYSYQTDEPGNHIAVNYNIKLVIYSGELADLKSPYHINHKEKIDYRYLNFKEASLWLDFRIETLEADIAKGDEENLLTLFPFLQELYQTQIALLKHF